MCRKEVCQFACSHDKIIDVIACTLKDGQHTETGVSVVKSIDQPCGWCKMKSAKEERPGNSASGNAGAASNMS